MPKRISDRQRLIGYAMNASEEQLQDAIETLKAIQSNKYPKQAKSPATRKARAKKAAAAQPELPAMPAEESEDEDVIELPRGRKIEKFKPDPHMVAAIEEGKREAAAG